MRVAVLVKQVPVAAELELRDGRLVRDGVRQEVNAYCRRANAKAVQLAGPDGEVVVFTMGPPAAEAVLREMVACGANRGVHLCDPAFAASDTLATARALAAAIRASGPFDLVLAGRNSVDSDTGQVPAQVAALLGLPFLSAARELVVDGGRAEARLETDDGYRWVTAGLPAVISAAERLVDPSKSSELDQVAPDRIIHLGVDDLGLHADVVGVPGSPTTVGPPRVHEVSRSGAVVGSVAEAVAVLAELGALPPVGAVGASEAQLPALPPAPAPGGPELWCYVEDHDLGLLGEAAELGHAIGATVVAVAAAGARAPVDLAAGGADRCVHLAGSAEPDDLAPVLADLVARARPWGMLFPASAEARVVASTVAVLNGWGLVGDAVRLDVSPERRLVAWKSALGGRLEVPITSRSPVQLATVRAGATAARRPRAVAACPRSEIVVAGRGRVRTIRSERTDDAPARLHAARSVIGVGQGVDPEGYPALEELCEVLGDCTIAATRKVTDRGWMPRSRQVGITGHVIAPRLYVAVGISGRFNHMMAVQASTTVLAVNADPDAEIFGQADVGLVADWRTAVPELARAIASLPRAA